MGMGAPRTIGLVLASCTPHERSEALRYIMLRGTGMREMDSSVAL